VDAERVLAARTREYDATERVSVARPCLVGQRSAGGPMLRCGSPAWLPGKLIENVPLVPVDERFGLQMVHADDVADALVRIVERRESGAFNLAADGIISGTDIARILRARAVKVRQEIVRGAVAGAWHAHLHPLDPGWVDMALQAPWVDGRRARSALGWRPTHSGCDVLQELVHAMVTGAGDDTGALPPRRGRDGLRRALTEGPVAHRTLT
jgi:UDP-glucose 4-epimerase